VRKAVPLGHPDFGKAFPCRCTVTESEEQRLARLQRYSNLGTLQRLTFSNLMPQGRSGDPRDQERFASAYRVAQEFAAQPQGWLVFTGPSGCGKTHLAAAIANQCLQNGYPCLFFAVPELLDHLRAAYRPDSEMAYDELFAQVKDAPVLALDDLGGHSSTTWAGEKLYQLVNHRYNAQLPTIFTSTTEVSHFEPRLQTRLTDPGLAKVFSLEPSGREGLARQLDSLDKPLLKGMTFKNFDPRRLAAEAEDLKLIEDAYREALKFAENPKDWLILAGSPGRGKTRLAASIANFRRQKGEPVLFVVVPDLLDHLRSSFNPQTPTAYDEAFEEVRGAPLLILDDLGSHTGTPWAQEKLFQIMNYRYNACLPTVITTSLTIKETDSRLASRLTDPQVSTILLLGQFDFWGKGQRPDPGGERRRRYRR